MNYIIYQVECIPDVTIVKNKIGANSGLKGIMNLHNTFLRIWNRKGLISDISLHLFYEYEPSSDGGEINCYIMLASENEVDENTISLFESLSLVEKYRMKKVNSNYFTENRKEYQYCSILAKNEVFTQSETTIGPKIRYSVPEWSINSSARLYEMFTVMSALNSPSLFRVDLYSVDYSVKLRNTVKAISDGISTEKLKKADDNTFSFRMRDQELDKLLDSYDDVAGKIENSPHFIVNVVCFCDELNDSKIILDASGADAIEEGSYRIASFLNSFNSLSLIEDVNNKYQSIMDSKTQLTHVLIRNNPGWKVCRETAEKYVLNYLPVLFTIDETEAFFKFPIIDDGEKIAMKMDSDYAPAIDKAFLPLGYDKKNKSIKYPLELLSKHAFICGVPGSGKTYTMLHLVTELHKNNIPFLVLEPAKKEYRAIFNYGEKMNDINLFSPHMNTVFPLEVNPLEFPLEISLCEHINVLMKVFASTFDGITGAVYSLLDKSICAAYEAKGWNEYDVNCGELEYPSLKDVRDLCEKYVNETTYDSEIKGNMKSFIEIRLDGLMKRDAGEVFNTNKSLIKPEEWLDCSCIIEMEDMGEQNRNFLTLLLCNYIRETLKIKKRNFDGKGDGRPNHVIFIEEAHNVISSNTEQSGDDVNPKVSATKFIVDMLAEVRALKESIIIADQLPTSMPQEIMKNTGLKIALRMTAKDEREYIGGSISASPVQIDGLSRYEKGKSLVFFESLERPIETQICKWNGNDDSQGDAELSERLINSNLSQYKNRILLAQENLISAAKQIIDAHQKISGEYSKLENIETDKVGRIKAQIFEDRMNHLEKTYSKLKFKAEIFKDILKNVKEELQ